MIIESQDYQYDALRDMKGQLDELREVAFERRNDPVNTDEIARYNASRRRFLQRAGMGAGGLATRGIFAGVFGTALAGIVASPAAADEALDIQILQTASRLERLAINTYKAALGLDFIKNGNKTVIVFAQTTISQHDEHRMAFQAQTETLGGKAQDSPHPDAQAIVDAALPGLTDPLKVVQLAEQLENVATQTYLENVTLLEDSTAKSLMATVMGVETQHAATLRAVAALLGADAAELVTIPVNPADLPAAAGSVGTPNAFEPTTNALAPASGAVDGDGEGGSTEETQR